jgi:hypothetical protein
MRRIAEGLVPSPQYIVGIYILYFSRLCTPVQPQSNIFMSDWLIIPKIVDDARPNFVDRLQAWLSLPNYLRSWPETGISV